MTFGGSCASEPVAGDNIVEIGGASTSMLLQTIISNQEVMTKRLIKLEKGMQEIFSQLQNVTGMVSSNCSSSEINTEIQPIVFNKIDDENELVEFEKTIDDRNNRKKMLDYFVSVIGKCNNAPVRSVALQLEQKMFTELFWSRTAWTGGRKLDGPKKFPFSGHIVCVAFMNEVIRGVCGMQMTDSAFSEFVKSRTRNSGYIRTTNRQATARAARKRKLSNVPGDGNNVELEQNTLSALSSGAPQPTTVSEIGTNSTPENLQK